LALALVGGGLLATAGLGMPKEALVRVAAINNVVRVVQAQLRSGILFGVKWVISPQAIHGIPDTVFWHKLNSFAQFFKTCQIQRALACGDLLAVVWLLHARAHLCLLLHSSRALLLLPFSKG
jgi:hypothetical protein